MKGGEGLLWSEATEGSLKVELGKFMTMRNEKVRKYFPFRFMEKDLWP